MVWPAYPQNGGSVENDGRWIERMQARVPASGAMYSRAGKLQLFLSSDALLSEICPGPRSADTRAELKE
jgi:hypothetical protein